MLIFALFMLMMMPSYYTGTYCCEELNKHDWEVWVPHRLSIAQTQDITLQPEFDVYPVGTVAVRFALKNNSDHDMLRGEGFRLVKKIDDVWRIVPMRVYDILWFDIAILHSARSVREIVLDIELIFGQLCEGEYAMIINDRWMSAPIKGRFSIAATGYEISVEDTSAAVARPVVYSLSDSTGAVDRETVTRETATMILVRSRHSPAVIFTIDMYEEIYKMGAVDTRTLPRNWWEELWIGH
ncbi:MAG: hypothetical protein FWC78_01510 [Defluviitaleaceae bacterium]|nr:hypothetical protein [Defluviitaleaceae bacterium]